MKGYVICKRVYQGNGSGVKYATLDMGQIVGFLDFPDLSCLIGTENRAQHILYGYGCRLLHKEAIKNLYIDKFPT